MVLKQQAVASHDGMPISAEQIELFKKCYRENNWVLNSQRLGDEETLYAMLPIEDVMGFVEKSEIKNAKRFGIYFGVFPTPFPEYALLAGRMTFCFVGINEEGNGVYYGEEQAEFGIGGFNKKEQVEIFVKNYIAERHVYNSQAIGKPDSIGASCTLATIKNFLSEKQHAGAIRIYIGAYPEPYDAGPELSKVQTVVLVGVEEGANRIAREILDGENPGLNMYPILVNS